MPEITPPADPLCDLDAERAVLGAVLLDSAALATVAGWLAARDFHAPAHAVIFEAMAALAARPAAIDVVTLASELRRRDRLHTVGGFAYLQALTEAVATTAHILQHARLVRDHARGRRAARAFEEGTLRLHAGEPLATVQATVAAALSAEGAAGADAAPVVGQDLDDLFTTALDRAAGRETALATPWPALDARLGGGGLWPGMYVLVGNTGAGKSQWAVQLAVHAARAGARVLYLALELSRRELAARVFGAVTDLAWSGVLHGTYPEAVLAAAFARPAAVRALPLHLECGAPYGYGVETLVARTWALRPRLVVLDYLQLCAGRAHEEPRVSVGRVSYAARAVARDLGAVVLVLSSTARANYEALASGPETEPSQLVGLGKESGEIEYAADGVFVLARDGRALDRQARVLVVAKNRHGALGRVALDWTGTAFASAADDAPSVVAPVPGVGR